MKLKLFIVILFFNINLNGQSKKFIKASNSKEFKFLTDQNDVLLTKNLSLVIKEGKTYGYSIERDKENKLFLETRYGNVLWMTKHLKLDQKRKHILPSYATGEIRKQYFFSGNSIEEGIIIKVSTEIALFTRDGQYYSVSESQINNSFSSIINILKSKFNDSFNVSENKTDFSNKNLILIGYKNTYDFLESFDIYARKINQYGIDYEINNVFRYGKKIESLGSDNLYVLGFTKETDTFSDKINLEQMYQSSSKSKQKTLDFLNFTINGIDLREVNTYDLKAMVNIFLGDCKKSNIPVPSLRTLKATFEPLEGNAIAYAYGSDNDSVIIIKVDPEKWTNSSLEKKWYILYHELGHDVLNLDHGEGGKMMYNFADREYNWSEFLEDKKYMFNSVKSN